MQKFKINTTTISEDGGTLTLNVTFTLVDETVTTVDVPFYAPQSVEVIFQGLLNRLVSEQSKYNATNVNIELKNELSADINIVYQVENGVII